MTDYSGRLQPVGRVGLIVSRYNELVTTRLLNGALAALRDARVPAAHTDTCWVDGAFELPAVAAALAQNGRHACLVALGAVIRGDTPHFGYVAGEAARGLMAVSTRYAIPIAFGVLTVDSLEQALERAGGAAGDKGREAAEAALRAADLLRQVRADHA